MEDEEDGGEFRRRIEGEEEVGGGRGWRTMKEEVGG